jgi:hypothetical protein
MEKHVPIGKIRDLKEVFELPEAKAMLKNYSTGHKNIKVINSIAFKFLD